MKGGICRCSNTYISTFDWLGHKQDVTKITKFNSIALKRLDDRETFVSISLRLGIFMHFSNINKNNNKKSMAEYLMDFRIYTYILKMSQFTRFLFFQFMRIASIPLDYRNYSTEKCSGPMNIKTVYLSPRKTRP